MKFLTENTRFKTLKEPDTYFLSCCVTKGNKRDVKC